MPETAAPPDIAAIYADIRAVSGLSMVNMIWRHFAALPGVLPWAWASVAPLVGSAAMDAARARTEAAIQLPPLPAPDVASWAKAGATEADLRRLTALNEVYIRGNLTNLLALTGLRLWLEAPDRPATRVGPGRAALYEPPALDPLPRIEDLEPEVVDGIRALAARHGSPDRIPSLYLALAPWPGVLAALPNWLAPLYDPPTLEAVRAGTAASAEGEALLPAPGSPPDGVQSMRPALDSFTRALIPDLLAVGLAIRHVLPAV